MVDTRNLPLQILSRFHAHIVEQSRRTDLHRVTEAYGSNVRTTQQGSRDSTHGIGVVQKPGVGTDLLHVLAEGHNHRRCAQGTKQSADADGVSNRLSQTVFLRDLNGS
jgi:hypothetical protein